MKQKLIVCFAILALYSCKQKDKTESQNAVETIVEDTLAKTAAGTADVSEVPAKEDKTVTLISEQLNVLLKKDLPALTKEERFFYYEAFDLNNDKKDEYFVGFSNPYFCGSGGCSGYILNNDGSLINTFTVTNFPIYVTTSSNENFYNLIMESRGIFHLVKMNNGKYPLNPSVQQKWKGEIPKESAKVLDIQAQQLEKHSF